MRKKLLIWCIAVFALNACMPRTAQTLTPSIQGSWQLTATLADIGNGKATWTNTPADSREYIKFNANGTIEGNALSDATHYKVTDTARLALTIQHNAEPIVYRYHIQANTLTLQPPCREACGMRFVRMK